MKEKLHIFSMFWDTMGCTKNTLGVRDDMGDMVRYWAIIGNKKRDWAMEG
jgi:hypothetical protein